MVRVLTLFCLAAFLISSMAFAASIPIGLISWDIHAPGSAGSFDILNQTGVNSTPPGDPTWPVTTPVTLGSLSLLVHFSDGSSTTFGSSYFTMNPDGSFNGADIAIGGANPQPINATLTGDFSPTTIVENDLSVHTIDPGFTTFFSDTPNLVDGDFGIIYATESAGAVPEPAFVSWMLLAAFFLGLVVVRNRHMFGKFRSLLSARSGMQIALFLTVVMALQSQSWAQVKLNAFTSPSTGVAGVDFVNANGSGFPSGTITPSNVTVTFALACGGPVAAFDAATSVTHILGTSYRIHFALPGSLTTNTYFVQVSDSAAGDANFTSTNCSQVAVTHTSSTLSACVPTSSLGVVAPVSGPAAVKSLVPNGAWASGTTGIQVVQLEAGGGPVVPPISVPTPDAINSCAGNPATGEGVCVANSAHVYHLSTANVPTMLTSGANAFTSFSGGSCENCGVAVNALTNQAVIAMGHSGSPSGTALQTLDLSTDTFGTPLNLFNHVSEDISIDPTRGYILSPNESNNYDIEQITSSTGAFTGEFGRFVSVGGEFDSAAEDCSTGIALSVAEFSNNVFLADLTQASFVPGAPGSWSSPSSITTIIGSYSAGLSGVTVAPGSGHLATVTGEFGGSSFSVLVLPSTSGSGTPGIVDYAYVSCITGFSAGLDPHTVTAYTSPNDGKAYTVFASSPPPSTLAVVDMAAVLALPRAGDGHTVIPPIGSCLTSGDGIVRFVATH